MVKGLKEIWRAKSLKKMTVNHSKSHLGCFNKLENQNSNTYCFSIGKNPINIDYSDFNEEIETKHKATTFKVGDRGRITKNKIIFRKSYTGNWEK